MDNRRKFTRIFCAIEAQLIVGTQAYLVEIQDISLKGALVKALGKSIPSENKTGSLTFSFNDEDDVIMHVDIIHNHEGDLCLRTSAMDIESITILKRTIELNLGDSEQLNAELSELSRTS